MQVYAKVNLEKIESVNLTKQLLVGSNEEGAYQ
jgi:hypothetical protein